jgi:hypothetical protein
MTTPSLAHEQPAPTSISRRRRLHHREFPAGYSAAGCSAEPASASPAFTNIHPLVHLRHSNMPGNLFLIFLSHHRGCTPGKLTGNFSILGPFLRFSLLIGEQIQVVTTKFPTQRNREFFWRSREFLRRNREFQRNNRTAGFGDKFQAAESARLGTGSARPIAA